MEAVEEAVYKDYQRWNKEEGNSEKGVDDFMEKMYAMKIGKGNIFDKIKAMNLPPISQDSGASSVLLENIATCGNISSSRADRKKRSSRGKGSVLKSGNSMTHLMFYKVSTVFRLHGTQTRSSLGHNT